MKKRTLRSIIGMAVVLAVVLVAIVLFGTLDTAAAEGPKTPTYNASSSEIYAQGTHLYIVDGTNGGTAVYYLNGSSKVYLNPNGAAGDDLSDFTIRGGGYGYVLAGDVNITMTGGKITQITCTGGGSTVADPSLGNVQGNAYVTVTGGTITRRLTVSWYNPFVGNVNFKITGGTIGNVYGYVERSNSGYPDCRVHGTSTVSITGSATITGEVGLGDGYHPVSGTKTLVTTVPVKLEPSNTLATPEDNMENFLYKNGNTWKVKGSVTIPEGATLTVNTGETLSVPFRATLNNNGTIINNGTADIKGTVNNSGSAFCINHNYTYECDQTCNLCGFTRLGVSHAAGDVFVHTDNYLAANCVYCGIEIGNYWVYVSDMTYTGEGRFATRAPNGEYRIHTDSTTYYYSDGTPVGGNPVNVGSYYVEVISGNAVLRKDFRILPCDLEVKSAPTVYHIYGENTGEKEIHATIVLKGTDTVVNGTWTREWRGNYLMAKFTPTDEHAGNVNDLEHQKITYNMTPATPTVTITTPSPAIMPGMKIRMNVTVENPHATFNVLTPPDYTVTYKVGANGTPVTVDGIEFTLPMDAATLGDTVYVTVKSLAHFGYYTEGTSNTVELFVGQVDYSEDINRIDNAISALNNANVKNAEDLAAAIVELNAAIDAAEQAAADGDTALKNELVAKINEADAALEAKLGQVEENLNNAITALNAADKKNADDLAQAIIDLNEAIDVAEAAAEAADTALKNELVAKIDAADKALQQNIDQVQTNLNNAVEALDKADKENAAALAQAIVDLTDAINVAQAAAEAFAKAGDDALNEALTKKIDDADAILQSNIDKLAEHLDVQVERLDRADAENAAALKKAIEELTATIKAAQAIAQATARLGDKELKAELTDKIDAADKALVEAIEALQLSLDETNATVDGVIADLDKAVEELEKAIDEGETKLESKITNFNDALKAAQAGLVAADAGVKAELTGKIDNAKKLLSEAIDALQKKLDETKAALDATDVALAKADADNKAAAEAADAALAAADAVLEAKDKKLTATSVVAVVLGSIALLGNGGLLTWILIDKKKLFKK